ncbi:hypothetical protein ACEP6V_21475 [Pseudomonas aeruginosa]|uniref:hypothetical protein n=1 Tax=Pseudomonadaceae TaxID=135621 RepID=UPI001F3D9106|nr:hypothetical protein [Pseudomonas alcaligenes]BDC78655.1 hypothetical protein MRCP2_p3900 [Pseudomonas alcaligenes]HBO6962685.1 hypothetical protein [Pseudomonas aeruginosa]HBO7218710.1 hypothetical protein [Pseudomonas aeruginosa]
MHLTTTSTTVSPEPPQQKLSLQAALDSGKLRPLDTRRVRAQLAFVSLDSASDARRAVALLLARVGEYYQAVDYCGPGYVYGKASSDWPEALDRNFTYDRMNARWHQQVLSIAHPDTGPARIFENASAMCFGTALKVAAFEIGLEVPETNELLRRAVVLLNSLVSQRAWSGVCWSDSKRRLGTKGIRRVLASMLGALCVARVGITPAGNLTAVFADDNSMRHVRSWSEPAAA